MDENTCLYITEIVQLLVCLTGYIPLYVVLMRGILIVGAWLSERITDAEVGE